MLLHGRKYVVLASSTRVEQGDDSTTTLQTLPTMKSMSLHLVRASAPRAPNSISMCASHWKNGRPLACPR